MGYVLEKHDPKSARCEIKSFVGKRKSMRIGLLKSNVIQATFARAVRGNLQKFRTEVQGRYMSLRTHHSSEGDGRFSSA